MKSHVQASIQNHHFPLIAEVLIKAKNISKVIAFPLFAFAFNSSSAHADVMLGASLPNDGFSRQVISDFNSVSPKSLAYVNVYSAFSHDWDNLYWQSSNVVAEGATPMITWMPIDLTRRTDNLLPEIALGYWDDYLTPVSYTHLTLPTIYSV